MYAIFCDAAFVDGRAWAGLTCPALGLRSAEFLGRAANSTNAEAMAIRWAERWAKARNLTSIIVNDNKTAVRGMAQIGVLCVWQRSTGNTGNWGVIEAHITAMAARREGKHGTWAATTRALRAAAEVTL